MHSKEQLIAMQQEIVELWEKGRIKVPVHMCGGNEDQLIEIFKEIRREDYVFSNHRNLYHFLLHGGSFDSFKRGVLADQDGLCGGRAGSMGTTDSSIRFYSSAIVGGLVNVATGVAWGLKASGKKERVHCFVGDAVLDGGHFWESLRYAQGWDLPIIFVIEFNNRSTCTDWVSRNGPRSDADPSSIWGASTSKFMYYEYEPTFPHVGTGKYIQF